LAQPGYGWNGVGWCVCDCVDAIPNTAGNTTTAANDTTAGVHGGIAAATTTEAAVGVGIPAQNAATDAWSGSFRRSKQDCANSAAFGSSHAACCMQRFGWKSDCQENRAGAQTGE
jgi:hypothetical protein